MLSASELWDMLGVRRKSELLTVASRDYKSFTPSQREGLKAIAEELYENWLNGFPAPSAEIMELAEDCKVTMGGLVRRLVFERPRK